MIPLPSSDWASVELSDPQTTSSMIPMVKAAGDRAAMAESPLPLPPPCYNSDHAEWDLDDAAFRASFCTPPASPSSSACAVGPSHRTHKRPRHGSATTASPRDYATAQRSLRLQSGDDGATAALFSYDDDDAPASPPYGLLGLSDSDEPF